MREVVQHWIKENGSIVVRSVGMLNSYYLKWQYGPMSIKDGVYKYMHYGKHYPKISTLPVLKRNGFKRSFHDYHPVYLFKLLLTSPKAETLFKAKQIAFLEHFQHYSSAIDRNWPSIKICIRNNYFPSDIRMWFDHLNSLRDLNKDLLNPKYVCPEDLISAHNKLNEKISAIRRKVEFEKLKAEIESFEFEYQKRMNKFFSINLIGKEIQIVPLKSVKEFLIEGDVLQHCVFENKYFKNRDSLILSARKENERLETIEVNLRTLKIEQIHGYLHTKTKYRNDILKLVKSNLDVIKKIRDKKVSKLELQTV